MPSRYKIAAVVLEDGSCPIADYMLDGTNETDLGVIIGAIHRLAHVGQALLDTDMAKRIDGAICELRKNRHRIMYAESKKYGGFILLSAFIKDTQKTRASEIKKANDYWQEYLKLGKVQEFDIPLDYDLYNL